MLELTCPTCGEVFRVNLFDRWRGQHYCGERCRKIEEGRRYRRRQQAAGRHG
jgi:endogenous inhibitor of DNA gyrase (YacG/DUF329 family)